MARFLGEPDDPMDTAQERRALVSRLFVPELEDDGKIDLLARAAEAKFRCEVWRPLMDASGARPFRERGRSPIWTTGVDGAGRNLGGRALELARHRLTGVPTDPDADPIVYSSSSAAREGTAFFSNFYGSPNPETAYQQSKFVPGTIPYRFLEGLTEETAGEAYRCLTGKAMSRPRWTRETRL
ncbi:MAG: hypothetical protein VYE81_03710 [Planctomycetota bacterium]|nr:hypothetical protein [Planctomycetota bacterium]